MESLSNLNKIGGWNNLLLIDLRFSIYVQISLKSFHFMKILTYKWIHKTCVWKHVENHKASNYFLREIVFMKNQLLSYLYNLWKTIVPPSEFGNFEILLN